MVMVQSNCRHLLKFFLLMKLWRRQVKKSLNQHSGGRQRNIFNEFGVAVKLLLNSYVTFDQNCLCRGERESIQECCKSNAM